MIDSLGAWVLRASASTAVVIVLVLAVQTVVGARLRPRWRYALWALVAARALAPALPRSGVSVFNFAPDIRPSEAVAAEPVNVIAPVVVRVDLEDALLASAFEPTRAYVAPRQQPSGVNWVAWTWLGGCAFFAILTAGRAVAFMRRLRRAEIVRDGRVLSIVEECRQSLGVRTPAPPILIIAGISGPALTGVMRPRIVVPPELLERLDDAELRFVLTHELVHLKRRDLLAEWLALVVRTVHWFNPLVWYAVARCRADRELACDEQVMRHCASAAERRSYGSTILKLAQGLPAMPRLMSGVAVVGILEGGTQFKRRIRMIARFDRTAFRWPALALFVLGVAVLASCTLTDRKSRPAESSKSETPPPPDEFGRVIRVYDTRDLLVDIPSFVPPPFFNDPTKDDADDAERAKPLPERTPQELFAELVKLVKDTTDPESWDRPGGSVLRELDGQLVVTASPEVHGRLAALFDQLRETRAIQLVVETRFLALDDETMATLKGDMPELFMGEVPPAEQGKPSRGASVFLTDEQARKLIRTAVDVKSSTITAPRITLFNGQRAYVLVQTQMAYVKSLKIHKDDEGKTTYDPVIDVASGGVVLDATGTVSPDRKHVTMVLRPTLSVIAAVRDVPFPNAPPGEEDLRVQVPDVRTSELRAIVTVPDGKTVLLRGLRGSMTIGGKDEEPVHGPSPVRDVLLLVKASIINQREVEADSPRRSRASEPPTTPSASK